LFRHKSATGTIVLCANPHIKYQIGDTESISLCARTETLKAFQNYKRRFVISPHRHKAPTVRAF